MHVIFLHSRLLGLMCKQDVEGAVAAMETAISVDNSCVQAYDTLASLELQRWVGSAGFHTRFFGGGGKNGAMPPGGVGVSLGLGLARILVQTHSPRVANGMELGLGGARRGLAYYFYKPNQ